MATASRLRTLLRQHQQLVLHQNCQPSRSVSLAAGKLLLPHKQHQQQQQQQQALGKSCQPLLSLGKQAVDLRPLHTLAPALAQAEMPPQEIQRTEITQARIIFDNCWSKIVNKYGDKLRTPKEIVWLNGAPGSGKGVNTDFILQQRVLKRAVTVSSLLENNTEAKSIMDSGGLVDDIMAGDCLLDCIFDPGNQQGLLVDGFPRTTSQVEFLKLLHDKLLALYHENYNNPLTAQRFPRPSFRLVVLWVSEEVSIKRQLGRAQQMAEHNRGVQEKMVGRIEEVRATDVDEAKARKRYKIFKEHYPALLKLKEYFPFNFIDAMGTIESCKEQISVQLRYQSEMELSEKVYKAITPIKLSKEIVHGARREMVNRLEYFCANYPHDFYEVIRIVQEDVMKCISNSSLAGHVRYSSRLKLFDNPNAPSILVDVLTDRGFFISYSPEHRSVPVRVNLQTGAIECKEETVHHFEIEFEVPDFRKRAKRE